jgi:aminoacylase
VGVVVTICIYNQRTSRVQKAHKTGDAEMISFLQEYLRINTAHPHPQYDTARALLKKRAAQDGFDYQEVALPSGNKVLVITCMGSDETLPALALNHHIDVVPAPNEEEWTTKPFEAQIHKGTLIARGVQDMKGVGVVQYCAVKALKDSGITPKRTIHMFAVPDEECGGFKGTKEFITTDAFKKLSVGYILDEGRTDPNKYLLKVDERKPLQVRLTCKGELAHGSKLVCKNALHELTQVLQHVVKEHEQQQKRAGTTQVGLLLSMNITSLNAGYVSNGNAALNMVPDLAQATIDVRVPPTMKLAEARSLLDTYTKRYPHTKYTVAATVDERPQRAEYRTTLYRALERAISQHHEHVEPHVSEGASDLRYYLALGIDGIGFTPFLVVDNIHGTNESVPINEIITGRKILTTFLKEFCC